MRAPPHAGGGGDGSCWQVVGQGRSAAPGGVPAAAEPRHTGVPGAVCAEAGPGQGGDPAQVPARGAPPAARVAPLLCARPP